MMENMISPTQRCLDVSKEDKVWGSILDNLRNEQKARRYKALNVIGNCNVVEACTIA